LRLIISAALIAALPASNAQAQSSSELCAKLSRGEPYIFSGIALRSAASTAAPVPIKNKAALLVAIYDLKNDWFTASDTVLATDGGNKTPVEFRPFLINGARQYCAEMFRANIFGTLPEADNYLLRCLVDRDGNGRYEAFHRYGELVPYNMRTGKAGEPSGQTEHDRPLATLIELVPLAAPSKSFRKPVVLTRISVATVSSNEMTLRLSAKIGAGPDDEKFRSYEAEHGLEQVVPLQGAASISFHGYEIALRQDGKNWVATTRPTGELPVALLCSGGIVEAGGNYSLFHAGGAATLNGDSVRANVDVPKSE